MNPRIAVTGLGLLSRFGRLRETWGAALEGRDGGVELRGREWQGVPVTKAAIVPEEGWEPRDGRLDRAVQFALAAARDAWEDAGETIRDVPPSRRAVLIGTARGGIATIEKSYRALMAGPEAARVSPLAIPHSALFCPASAVSIDLNCKGPSVGLTAACASALHAIGIAARLIQSGMAEIALAGGTEASLTPWYVSLVHRSGILTADTCRPFDRRRDGTLLGEGAGILVLEAWDRAVARGARIRAELLGYGASSDAESLYAPSADGGPLASAIGQAMSEASVGPDRIGYVKAHGTATVKGDDAEAKAIHAALGPAARRVPTSSLKPVLGHTVGASAAIEGALAIMALADRRLPPTATLQEPDPGLGLHLVQGAPLKAGDGAVLSLSSGFGGSNGCLLFGR